MNSAEVKTQNKQSRTSQKMNKISLGKQIITTELNIFEFPTKQFQQYVNKYSKQHCALQININNKDWINNHFSQIISNLKKFKDKQIQKRQQWRRNRSIENKNKLIKITKQHIYRQQKGIYVIQSTYAQKLKIEDILTNGLLNEDQNWLKRYNNDQIYEFEKQFWQNVEINQKCYGNDIKMSFCQKYFKKYSYKKYNSFLKTIIGQVDGLTVPYCYFGTRFSCFSWHKQDLDLGSINFLHCGAPKLWYCLNKKYNQFFQSYVQNYFAQNFKKCKSFIRHKTVLVNPYMFIDYLRQNNKIEKSQQKNVIVKFIQNPGQFIFTFKGCYHAGFNLDYNLAQAINFTDQSLFDYLAQVDYCKCKQSTVQIYPLKVLQNLQLSNIPQKQLYIKKLSRKIKLQYSRINRYQSWKKKRNQKKAGKKKRKLIKKDKECRKKTTKNATRLSTRNKSDQLKKAEYSRY